jgi:glyoxylate/hydroxypyruvate reductase A
MFDSVLHQLDLLERWGIIVKPKYRVLLYNHNPEYVDRYERLLREARKDLQLLVCKNGEQIGEVIDQADIIFSAHTFPGELVGKAGKLKWIQSMSAGVENFARSNLLPPDVVLTKIKGVFGPLMSEYVVGYILAITQNMKKTFENKEKKRWKPFLVDSIRRKTVGVMGLGSVGAYIAFQVHLMGATVIALEEQEKRLPYVSKEYAVTEIEEFLGRSDFVVVAFPLTDTTEGIVGEREFGMMKESAYLINVSRGPLVREGALLKALKQGSIAGAVLDVFHEEPLPRDHPLWDLDNVIITPHISGPSIPEDIAKIFIENLRRFEEGKTLEGVVDHEKEY